MRRSARYNCGIRPAIAYLRAVREDQLISPGFRFLIFFYFALWLMVRRVKELLSFLDSNAHPVAILWASLPKMRPDLLCILDVGTIFAPVDIGSRS